VVSGVSEEPPRIEFNVSIMGRPVLEESMTERPGSPVVRGSSAALLLTAGAGEGAAAVPMEAVLAGAGALSLALANP
jgi:hypothetical protein